uniref:Uncharacterized protein n=1 Tax=Anguilla anguilla TaxID=7936 RepID=A0A0E9SA05_ANGAN
MVFCSSNFGANKLFSSYSLTKKNCLYGETRHPLAISSGWDSLKRHTLTRFASAAREL